MSVTVQTNVPEPEASKSTPGKRPYAPPQLTLFGHVAALTQSGSCSANSDGQNSPCQVGTTSMGMGSDRRMKENIVRIGDHPAGFGLYLFRYRAEHRDEYGAGRHFGVMADEVAPICPEAVVTREDGFQAVRYDVLGIEQHWH